MAGAQALKSSVLFFIFSPFPFGFTQIKNLITNLTHRTIRSDHTQLLFLRSALHPQTTIVAQRPRPGSSKAFRVLSTYQHQFPQDSARTLTG